MLRHPAGSDQNDVEADIALRVVRMIREPKLGRGDDPAFAAFRDGFGRFAGALAGLDLDENARAPAAGDDIDLAEGRLQRRAAIR